MQHQLRNVQQIQAAKEGAFAAILADGISDDKENIFSSAFSVFVPWAVNLCQILLVYITISSYIIYRNMSINRFATGAY